MRALIDTFTDIGPLRIDLFSYQKESETDGGINNGINNGVLVVQRFLNVAVDDAVSVVNDLADGRLRQFERIVSTELPALLAELAPETRQQVLRYVESLQDWMAGDLQWSKVTGRYRSAPAVRGLAGLGMSAARVEALL
jgi:germacradienol/geosmin synthase